MNRIISCLDGLSEADLNWRPLENANSLYVIATHILGTTEENIIGTLCGQQVNRQREAEFLARGTSFEPIHRRWSELRNSIKKHLDHLPSGELDRKREHPRRGQLSGRDVLIVVARHAAEHMGHAELTRDLFLVNQGKKPPSRKY